jgi:hypothetical protein
MTKRQFGDFKVEDWYSYISQYTYPTEFLPLTVGQALAIMHAYEIGHKYQNVSNKDGIYTPDDQKIIQNLTQDIQTQMDNMERILIFLFDYQHVHPKMRV